MLSKDSHAVTTSADGQDQLIPVFEGSIAGKPALLCNARDLHEFLEVGRVFRAWITERIEAYGFTEGSDYLMVEDLSRPVSDSAKARPQVVKDYHLTLDMAKELAMVERNEKGRQVRRYFIECERKVLAQSAPKPRTPRITNNMPSIMRAKVAIIQSCAKMIQQTIPGTNPTLVMAATMKCIYANTGLDMEFMREGFPGKEQPVASLNATAIGKEIGLSSVKVNQLLESLGLQYKNAEGDWEPTEAGKAHGEMIGFARNGHEAFQLKWKPSIIGVARAAMQGHTKTPALTVVAGGATRQESVLLQ